MGDSVMLGITTWNRPSFADKCVVAVRSTVSHLCDAVLIHNDCSDRKYRAEYQRVYKRMPDMIVQDSDVNQGVAASKNALLQAMLDKGADHLFLCEDDIVPTSPLAITGYIEAAEASSMSHLSFHNHGPANAGGPVDVIDPIAYYPHSIGAWTYFSRECLESVGLLDENFHQAWEHVEHELRLIQAGYMGDAGPHRFPDAYGSDGWLRELPHSIEKSSIRPRPDWRSNIKDGLSYWQSEKPDTFDALFGEGMPLHAYAMGILA